MQKWEYLVMEDLDDRDLNLYGIDGWELVTVSVKLQSTYFFKRPLDEKDAEFIGVIPEAGHSR